MSNYTKTTDFEAKDSLPTGDSGKIIRGAEFETEFDAISTAIATKADTAGPTFTGTLTFETISDGTIGVTAFVDEDDMSSDSATLVPTQQSVKAYVDSQVTAQDLDFQADTGGALSIDLDSETLTFTGGTGIDTSGSGNAVTFAIDSTVATLTGSQTLTNKTLTSPVLNTGVSGTAVLDEDDMSSNSATQLATQQSIKAYVDSQVGANNELSEILANGNTTGGTNIVFGDSASVSDDRLVFGAGSDLQIYHSGTHSYIDDAGTGNLTLRGNASVRVEKYEGEVLADFAADGAVSLYHDNSVKIATTSTGVSVTGNVAVSGTVDGRDVATDGTKLDGIESGATADQTAAEIRTLVESATDSNVFTDADHSKLDGIEALADVTDTTNVTAAGAVMDSELTNETAVKSLDQGVATTDSPTFAGLTTTADVSFGDNDKAIFGAGSDLQIYHDGSASYIDDQGTGSIIIKGTNFAVNNSANSQTMIAGNDGADVKLFYAGANKLATTSTGIDVTGAVVADSLTVGDSHTIGNGTGDNLLIQSSSGENITLRAGSTREILLQTDNSSGNAVQIYANNDVAFYEDLGNTPKFFWDASTERLGIGNTSPTTALDVTGTVTADAAEVSKAQVTTNFDTSAFLRLHPSATTNSGGFTNIFFGTSTTDNYGISIGGERAGTDATPDFAIRTHNLSGTGVQRLRIEDNGDISFYEDTGTTAKLFWDASEESLGIGTSSPTAPLTIGYSGAEAQLQINNSGSNRMVYLGAFSANEGILRLFNSSNVETVRIPAESTAGVHTYFNAGNVGIGTSNPSSNLDIESASEVKLDLNCTAGKVFRLRSTTSSEFIVRDSTAGADRLVIDGSGNVGIGTSSPAGNLHISGSGDRSLLITGGTSGTTSVQMGDSSDADAGAIRYDNSNNSMQFFSNAAERLRIDSSGNLLVSKTSNDNSTAGVVLRDTGEGSFVVSGGRSGLFNRLSSDGEIVSFRKDNTTVGSINTNAGAFVVKGASTSQPVQLQTHDGNEDIEVDPDGFIKMETAGSERLRIDSSGHVIAPYGVTLGTAVGTYAAANTLDDYEEGTWTPTVAGSTTAGTATYAVQNGKYTKIGRQVILQFEVGVNSWSVNPVGSIRIGGVPFTAASGQVSTGSIMASDLNFDVTNPVTAALYMAGGTEMQIYLTEDDAAWDQQSISAEAFSLISTITYYV